jgi:hypothetical protein
MSGSQVISPSTVDEAVALAVASCDRLEELGHEIADEWQYVTDLAAAWAARLRLVAAGRGPEPLSQPLAAAVETAAAEAALITDPHRAIDWLSTFPQVVLAALGERP